MGKKRPNKKLPKYEQEELDEYLNSSKEKPEKTMEILNIKHVELTPKQLELMQLIEDNKITIATGPPGTSKSFTTCFTALKEYKKQNYEKIIITKPTEIIGGTDLGHLPGGLVEKISVYMDSFIGTFSELLDGKKLKELLETNKIEFKPAQFMRGKTFNDSIIIIDEFQNFDIKTLMAIVTRLGRNSKMIFIGDTNQNDINKKYVAVDIFKQIINGLPGTVLFEFDRSDIVRDPLLIEIIDRYEKLKAENKLPNTKRNT